MPDENDKDRPLHTGYNKIPDNILKGPDPKSPASHDSGIDLDDDPETLKDALKAAFIGALAVGALVFGIKYASQQNQEPQKEPATHSQEQKSPGPDAHKPVPPSATPEMN